jgi:hypothetical protein
VGGILFVSSNLAWVLSDNLLSLYFPNRQTEDKNEGQEKRGNAQASTKAKKQPNLGGEDFVEQNPATKAWRKIPTPVHPW